ncbi:MAG: acyl-CoA dehydrogenase family protein [Rhizomicrobium sp.]
MLNNLKQARPKAEPLLARAERAAVIAAAHADPVDAQARFPAEAVAALKAENLFGILVPGALGGEQASVSEVVDVCYRLGRACSSTGMIYAMHQVKAACVAHHGMDSAWHRDFMGRMIADQLLLASSTTEGGGGNVRSSEAAVEHINGHITLQRDASVISYGAEADAVVTTARRAPDADGSDQVLIVLEKKNYPLEKTGSWNTLGMRGTCSAGFSLKAMGHPDQIMPVPYGVIHTQSMVPTSHLMWSGVWCGVAAGAVERARKFMRKAARAGGDLPPGMPHFTKSLAALRSLRALIAQSLARYENIAADPKALGAVDFQTAINLLKVDASESAVETVMAAMRATGLSGYRNDSDVSIGRALRDILSSPIMINNDRILSNLSSSTLLSDIPTSVRD